MKQFRLILSLLALVVCLNTHAYKKQSLDILVNGQSRNMVVFTPDVLPDGVPLMITTHGMNQDPEYQFGSDKMYELIDAEKFVVVYPRSNGSTWDVGGDNDKNFILKIIDDMQSRYGIDTNRVYWSGFSMGSMLIYHCMPTMLDKIAAFAPTSGIQFSEQPWNNCKKPVNLIQCHAYGDDVFPLNQYDVRSYVMHFKDVDKTTSYKKTAGYRTYNGAWYDGDKEVWSGGTNGSEVELFLFNNGGHWPMDGNKTEIWNFCKRFSLDPNIPSGTIVSPKADAEYTRVDTFDVVIEAADKDGFVKSIVLYLDGGVKARQTFAEASADGKYSLTYTWTRPAKGNHTIKAVITDNDDKTRELSRSITIADAEPLALVEINPEDDSFDLTSEANRTFLLTFNYPVNCDKIKGSIRLSDGLVQLKVAETGFNKTVTMSLPDTAVVNDGRRTLNVSGMADSRGITLSIMTLHFTYGYTDPNDTETGTASVRKIKQGMLDALAAAQQLYDETSTERYTTTESLREPVKAAIDRYTDFKSTSPTEWKAATQELKDIVVPLQERKDLLDTYFAILDKVAAYIEQYADNEVVSAHHSYNTLVKAYANSLYNLPERNLKKVDRINAAIKALQGFIDKFEAYLATDIKSVFGKQTVKSQAYDLKGYPVDSNYKGVVIKHGKKYIQR